MDSIWYPEADWQAPFNRERPLVGMYFLWKNNVKTP